jgi:predicted transcriptional regulator
MLSELKSIKMLMVLQLVEAGVKQSTIAQYLGVSDATISRMMPRKQKSAKVGRNDG